MEEFLTKEQIQQIVAESVKEALGGLNLDRRFEALSEQIEESNPLDEFLDALIDEADDEDYDDEDYDDEDYDDEDYDSPEILRMRRELDAIKREAQADREAREEAERDREIATMRSTALEAIRKSGRAVNPEALLKLLEADGRLTEKGGAYVVASRDEYGELTRSLDESLGGLLDGDYSFMASARPGTGTGATPGSSYSGGGSSKYFRDKPSAQDVQAIMKDPEKRKEYLAEYGQALG